MWALIAACGVAMLVSRRRACSPLVAFQEGRKTRDMRRCMSERTPLELRQELARQLAAEHGPTIETIFLIADIDRRRTYVEEGFSSTWDYLRRVFNQSDTMIHYRLSCARAVNRFPQVIEPLRSGRICMTTLATLMEGMNESNCDE